MEALANELSAVYRLRPDVATGPREAQVILNGRDVSVRIGFDDHQPAVVISKDGPNAAKDLPSHLSLYWRGTKRYVPLTELDWQREQRQRAGANVCRAAGEAAAAILHAAQ